MPGWRGHGVLQLPVPPLEDFVRGGTSHYDPSFLGQPGPAGESFVHAHLTLLGPFDVLPASERVRRALQGHGPVRFWLRRLDTFPNGIIHAVPEPDDGARGLTAVLRREFPEVLPYRGEFPVRPHVTLDAVGPGIDEDWVRTATSRVLPVLVVADRVDLVWYESGGTRLVETFSL
ncbi:2'-5' RNA ligase family protein [Luteococcus peritonei]|uniref:2'-5' RNA ligase family protein n=1 Tax=Luteococcus peritonei TaxID=88874 RepID=A0ABW4RUA1_9ACTN